MKKLKLVVTTLLMGVLLFALASCGGATGTLSSFVSAVKKADFEKAATYVVGTPNLSNPADSEEIYQYVFEKAAGSFSYTVEEETTDSEGTTCTVKISYSGYSGTAIAAKVATQQIAGLISGVKVDKSTVDEIIKEMDKKESTATVTLVKSEEGEWQISALSATALILAIYG